MISHSQPWITNDDIYSSKKIFQSKLISNYEYVSSFEKNVSKYLRVKSALSNGKTAFIYDLKTLNLKILGPNNQNSYFRFLILVKKNFENIKLRSGCEASEEDLKYFKSTFESIIFDQTFFKMFKISKIRKFVLEIS